MAYFCIAASSRSSCEFVPVPIVVPLLERSRVPLAASRAFRGDRHDAAEAEELHLLGSHSTCTAIGTSLMLFICVCAAP